MYISKFKCKHLKYLNTLLKNFKREDFFKFGKINKISHRPKVAPEAYAITLWPGLKEKKIKFKVPELYLSILKELNGAHFYKLSLFGIPESNLLKRDGSQQLSLITANETWIIGFKNTESLFYFGSSQWNSNENIGYFISPNNEITSQLKKGKVIEKWSSFNDFLKDEIQRNESKYPAYEKFMYKLRNL